MSAISVRGLDQTLRKINATSRDISNTSGLAKDVSLAMKRDQLRAFANEVSPFGVPWKRSRAAERRGGQTLTDTGRLRASYVVSFSNSYAQIETNLVYAKPHHLGEGKQIERRQIGYGPQLESEVLTISQRYLARGFNGN